VCVYICKMLAYMSNHDCCVSARALITVHLFGICLLSLNMSLLPCQVVFSEHLMVVWLVRNSHSTILKLQEEG
jgi:hypothetical protein